MSFFLHFKTTLRFLTGVYTLYDIRQCQGGVFLRIPLTKWGENESITFSIVIIF